MSLRGGDSRRSNLKALEIASLRSQRLLGQALAIISNLGIVTSSSCGVGNSDPTSDLQTIKYIYYKDLISDGVWIRGFNNDSNDSIPDHLGVDIGPIDPPPYYWSSFPVIEVKTGYWGELYYKDEGNGRLGFQALIKFTTKENINYYFALGHLNRYGSGWDYYTINTRDSYGRVYYDDVDVFENIGYMGNSGNCITYDYSLGDWRPITDEERELGYGFHTHIGLFKNYWDQIDPCIY